MFDAASVVLVFSGAVRATVGLVIGLLIVGTDLRYVSGRHGSHGNSIGPPVVGRLAGVFGTLQSRIDGLAQDPDIVGLGLIHGLLPRSLNRGDGCEIHENAYWDLQTYLGLRENLAANQGARSFTYEPTRERTPLGHSHRAHIRDLSIAEIREMYRQAVNRLLSEVAETEEFL